MPRLQKAEEQHHKKSKKEEEKMNYKLLALAVLLVIVSSLIGRWQNGWEDSIEYAVMFAMAVAAGWIGRSAVEDERVV